VFCISSIGGQTTVENAKNYDQEPTKHPDDFSQTKTKEKQAVEWHQGNG
jgi:hypothetical protein